MTDNLKKIKIFTVVGTRPEIIRLSVIIKKFDEVFEHTLIHTGQNYDYELNEIFYKDLNIRKPDFFLNAAKETSVSTIAECLLKIEPILLNIKPDAFFVLGDTNSCLTSLAAKKLKIPIFHYEAGNRCFDMRVPEEINRKIVDNLADINFTYSSNARQNLLNEGFSSDRVIKIGSPMKEIFLSYDNKIDNSNILKANKLKKNNYFLLSAHREENVDDVEKLTNLISISNTISKQYNMDIIFSAHPRTQKKLKHIDILPSSNIRISKPFSFTDYIHLQKNAFLTISDSGSLSEEAYLLKSKAINIRSTQERHEAVDSGVLILTDINARNIFNAIEYLKSNNFHNKVDDYEVDNVSNIIIKNIISFYNYINMYTWLK